MTAQGTGVKKIRIMVTEEAAEEILAGIVDHLTATGQKCPYEMFDTIRFGVPELVGDAAVDYGKIAFKEYVIIRILQEVGAYTIWFEEKPDVELIGIATLDATKPERRQPE